MRTRFWRTVFIFLLFSSLCCPAMAKDAPTVAVGKVSVEAGSEMAVVPIFIANNPGITSFELLFDVGRELILLDIAVDEREGTLCGEAGFSSSGASAFWDAATAGKSSLEGDGLLFYLCFEAPPPGSYPLSLAVRSVTGTDGESLQGSFEATAGLLTVQAAASFEVVFYEDAAREKALNADAPTAAATLFEAVAAVEQSSSKVGSISMKTDVSDRGSVTVGQGVDLALDLNGHGIEIDGAHAIVNAGTLALSDSGTTPGLVSSHGGSAVYNTGTLAEVSGGAYSGQYAILNEGVVSPISGGLFYGAQKTFLGNCPLAGQTRLAVVEDERSSFYGFWQVLAAPDCTVTFYDEDATTVLGRDTVSCGGSVTPPDNPVKEEDAWFTYEFEGWYTAQTGGQEATFTDVTASFAVYARYSATAHVHHYLEEAVVAPTCVSQGYTLYRCRCGDSYRDKVTSMAAHEWEETKDKEVLRCKTCGTLRAAVRRTVTSVQQGEDTAVVQACCGLAVQFGGAQVALHPEALAALAKEERSLCIKTDTGELELDHAALYELDQAAGGRGVSIGLERLEPVRGMPFDRMQREIQGVQERGGAVYTLTMTCEGEPLFGEGFEKGLAVLRVPFEAAAGTTPIARHIGEQGATAEQPLVFEEGVCALSVSRGGTFGLLPERDGTRVGLYARERHVNAGEQVEIDLILQAAPGESLEGATILVQYDADALTYVETRDLLGRLEAAKQAAEGSIGVLKISGSAGQEGGVALPGTRCVLATLVFSFDQEGKSGGTSVQVSGTPVVTLSGEACELSVGDAAELSLWNLTVRLSSGAHTAMPTITAYVNHGRPGLYEDAARQRALPAPSPVANTGYELSSACWFASGAKEGVSLADLRETAFAQDASYVAAATPIRYTITYHAEPGKGDEGNPAYYTVESGPINLRDATWTHGKFVMWADGEDSKAKAVGVIPAGSMGDLSLWAVFERYTYTVAQLPQQVSILSGVSQGKVQSGEDVTFTVTPDGGCRTSSVCYTIGGASPVELAASNGVYRIDGDLLNGKLTILVTQEVDGALELVGKDGYRALPAGYCLVKFTASKALTSGAFVLDETPLFYAPLYSDAQKSQYVYVTVVPESKAKEDILSRMRLERDIQMQTLSHSGDLTGDGVLDEQDARLAYLLYTGHWDTDESFALSIRQRLEADWNGDGRVDTTDVQQLLALAWQKN